MHEYDLIADWYASNRRHEIGVSEVTAFASKLRPGASVLDIGCGNGVPITRALLAAGCAVSGLDSSPEMLARFRINCPGTPSICASVVSHDFSSDIFDGAVAWGVMFHLDHADQEKAIANVARAVNSGALFLFTSGDESGSFADVTMDGVPFRNWSFSVGEYRDLLAAHSFTLIDTNTDRWENTYYLAQRAQRTV